MYQPTQPYGNYQPMPQPYPDRLAQLQSQYQQAVNVPQMVPTPMSGANQQINQGLLWVSGEVGAKSYLVAPNSTVLLMDSDASRFYLKSADQSGMPSLRIFEYTEVQNTPQTSVNAPNSDLKELDSKYVTREEYDGLKSLYGKILERLDSVLVADEPVEPIAKSKSRGRGGNGNNEQSDI